jgi:hypothetical protein
MLQSPDQDKHRSFSGHSYCGTNAENALWTQVIICMHISTILVGASSHPSKTEMLVRRFRTSRGTRGAAFSVRLGVTPFMQFTNGIRCLFIMHLHAVRILNSVLIYKSCTECSSRMEFGAYLAIIMH